MEEFTKIIDRLQQGDERAAEELLPLVYEELRRLASVKLASERSGQTLQATALVHEAYLRLLGDARKDSEWNGRGHFFGAAAEAMRRILIERARRKQRIKHGGNRRRWNVESLNVAAPERDVDIEALSEALDRLAEVDPAAADVVKLRYFAGTTIEETAQALSISIRTVNRHFAYAKAWLYQELSREN